VVDKEHKVICRSRFDFGIHHGPGFRVYFVRRGAAVYVLLCGGDKSSQRRDIAMAKRMARELKESGR
jgi:putative addiction module killer protein